MQFLNDSYVIDAADIIPLWAGRCYNHALGRWESVHGVSPTPCGGRPETKARIKSVNFTVHATSGALRQGVMAYLFIVGDPVVTGNVVPLIHGVQRKVGMLYWTGDEPLLWGIEWRIHQGGLVAGDYVDLSVGYEGR